MPQAIRARLAELNRVFLTVALATLITAAGLTILATKWIERGQVAELTTLSERSAVALDMQFKVWETAVDGLAASHALTRAFDVSVLRWDAARVAEQVGGWIALTPLDDPSLIVFSTSRKSPDPFRVSGPPPELLRAIEKSRVSGQAEISDAFMGKVVTTPVFAVVRVATSSTGQEFAVVLTLDVKLLSRELERATMQDGGFITVIDGSYRIIARSSRIDEFLFKTPPMWLIDRVKATPPASVMVASGPALPGAESSSYLFTNRKLHVAQAWSVFVGKAEPDLALSSYAVIFPVLGSILVFIIAWAIESMRTAARRREDNLRTAQERFERDEQVRIELQDALDKAQAAETARRDMLGVLGHEMRTPVLSALAAIEMFPDDLKAQDTRSYLPLAEKGLKALQSLIDDVLDLARINSGELHIDKAAFCLTDLLEEVAGIMDPMAQRHRLDFMRAWPESPISVIGDRCRTRQILINLLTNAFRYTRMGHVKLEGAWQTEEDQMCHIRLSVTDTGTGIPEDKIADIFQPFYRIDRGLSERINGLGLGLPITQKLAQALGGSIEVQSQVGHGSTFSFVVDLAFAPPEQYASQSQFEPDESRPLAGKSILVVEDSILQAQMVVAVLQKLGANAETVGMGCDAIEAVRDRAFDVVTIDLGLPDMSGVSLVRSLIDAGSSAIHVALSANPGSLVAHEAALFDAVAMKTTSKRQLSVLMETILQARISERPLQNA